MAIERLFIGEGVKEVEVKKYLTMELKRAGLASIVIQRTPLVTKIVIYCDRPALVIGRKGSNVKEITRLVEQNYKIEKPEIEVKKVDNPNLEPNIIAYRIASALERGMNSRKVGYKALQAVMRSGAKGAEIIMSGKLVGKSGRSRVLKMKAGYLKKCGRPAIDQVRHGQIIASCKPGVIGVEVSVVQSNVHFPDEINVIKPEDFKIEEEIVEVKEEATGEEKKEPKVETKPGEKESKAEKPKESPKPEEKGAKEVKPEAPKQEANKEAPKVGGPKKEEKKPEKKEAEPKAEKKAVKKTAKKAAKKPARGSRSEPARELATGQAAHRVKKTLMHRDPKVPRAAKKTTKTPATKKPAKKAQKK